MARSCLGASLSAPPEQLKPWAKKWTRLDLIRTLSGCLVWLHDASLVGDVDEAQMVDRTDLPPDDQKLMKPSALSSVPGLRCRMQVSVRL